MAKNKLEDLNNHLFAQLERLSDEDISSDELTKEINRAKAVNGVEKNIIDNAKTVIEAFKFTIESVPSNKKLPELLKSKEQ